MKKYVRLLYLSCYFNGVAMTFSRFFKAGFIAASTLVAFAGGTTDQHSSASGNMITDLIPAMFKNNAYIGIEGGATYFNDHSIAREYAMIDNHLSSSSSNGGAYGFYFGIGGDLVSFEIGLKQFDNISQYNIAFSDVTATIDNCVLTINDNHAITISNANDCAVITSAITNGVTIDSITGDLTTSATYPYLAAKIGTKIRGINTYVRPGVVFAGNHNLDADATATFDVDGVNQTAKLGRTKNYEVNPTFIGVGIQYPLYDAIALGAEFQAVNQTSSINLNLTYKLG